MLIFAKVFLSGTAEFWEKQLEIFSVPAVKVRRLDEVLSEQQVLDRKLTKPIEIDGAVSLLHMPTLGFKVDGNTIAPKTAPPRLGEDNSILLNSPK